MPGRIALRLSISRKAGSKRAVLRIFRVGNQQELSVQPISLVLTLEQEPGVTFARGQLSLLDTNVTYPIQSNASLFEALSRYIASNEAPE